MRILEQLKLEWTDADLQAFRSMWMSRVPLQERDLIVNGYRYLKSEKVERYPWEE